MNILAYVHLRNIFGSTGAGRVARNIIEALHQLGTDDIKILGDRSDHSTVVSKVGAPWTTFDYKLFEQDTSRQQRSWTIFDAPKAEHFWSEADIVYCTGEAYVPSRRARQVNLIHDAAFFERDAHLRSARYFIQQAKWRILFSRISKNADLIHTVSQFSADRLQHYFPSFRGRVRVVHNAVPAVFFSSDRSPDAAALARWGLMDRRYILLPRGLSHRKNADLVLDAWPRLRQLHPDLLLVVTSHNDRAYLDRAAALDAGIIPTGFVDDDHLRALYRGACVVWFPSSYEGFGMPVLESMACGTPVVASAAASLPEIIGSAGILVPPNKAEEHIDALDQLISNATDREELVRRGYAHAQQFTWEKSAKILRMAFESIL